MNIFKYYANDKYGVTFKGEMSAENAAEVISRLKKNNIMPITIKKVQLSGKKVVTRNSSNKRLAERKNLTLRVDKSDIATKKKHIITRSSFKAIKVLDVITFTQNLYLLKKADFNNIHALETIYQGCENENLKIIIQDILNGVEVGQNMYSIMEYYPDIFPPIYIGIVKSGELSGTLVNSLEQARRYLESSTTLKTKIRSILLPNIAQFVFLVVMLIAGILFAIPKVQDVYAGVGLSDKIPKYTIVLSNIVIKMIELWYVIIPIILSIIFVIYMYLKTPEGKYKFDLFKYSMPIFGKLMSSIDLQKFLNALKLNLQNSMRLQDALDISKEVVTNVVFLSILEACKSNLLLGEDWVEPIERSQLFPNIVQEMLRIGMDTDLAEMTDKIEEYIQEDIDRKLARTVKVLPEVTYAIVGVVIVIFVIIVMVPIMNIYMGTFLFEAYL